MPMLRRPDATLQGCLEPQANNVREWWTGGRGERPHIDTLRAWNIVWIMVGNFYVKITGDIAAILPGAVVIAGAGKIPGVIWILKPFRTLLMSK